MITKVNLKRIAEEKNIPFSYLLSATVCEVVMRIISNSRYANELFLINETDFEVERISQLCISKIKYEFCLEIDDKMQILYLRDILKEVVSNAEYEGLSIKGSVLEKQIKLNVMVDDMYVPIDLDFLQCSKKNLDVQKKSINYILDSNQEISFLVNLREEILARNIVEILEKLELINDMDYYFEIYEDLVTYTINGRKVRECIIDECKKRRLKIEESRMNLFYSYRDNSYMKKKWKVELRQKKRSKPQWTDLMNCLFNFITPIVESIETNVIFLGEWMPQLKRYLD